MHSLCLFDAETDGLREAREACFAYLWHDGLAVLVRDIAEWHLGALVLIEFELGEVNMRHFFQRD